MKEEQKYKKNYYIKRHEKTVYSARAVLEFVLNRLSKVNSAVDFGCGVGTWLSVLKECGVEEILGLDGDWVDRDLLVIPDECYRISNLNESVKVDREFDLAISLEVAEHLLPESATNFVESLCQSAKTVIFSAAVPGQEGLGHVNCQWPEYWAALFSANGFECLDIIRPRFWRDDKIPVYYRQNCLLFVHKDRLEDVSLRPEEVGQVGLPISMVHPKLLLHRIDWLEERMKKMSSVAGSAHLFLRACKRVALRRN